MGVRVQGVRRGPAALAKTVEGKERKGETWAHAAGERLIDALYSSVLETVTLALPSES